MCQLLFLQVKFMINRHLSNCSHVPLHTNCKKCGLYLHFCDPALKTTLYDSVTHSSASKYLKHLRRRQCENLQHRQISQSTSILLQAICDKFQYCLQTLTLGMYVFIKSCQKQLKDEKFWASAALLVASKGIQLDKKVPYLNRYQRYADKSFSQEDYEMAQKTIFEEMNFNLQYATFITFLNFYMTNGIIFKSDNCSFISIRIIEDDILSKAKILVKRGNFIDKKPELLALSLIKEYRQKHRLNPWPKQLETLSGYKSEQIIVGDKSEILQPLRNIESRIKQKVNLMESNESKKFSRKRLDNTMKLQSIKENSMKLFQPSNIGRNQTFSSVKYSNSFSTSQSTQRITPIQSFISRRV